MNALLKAYSKLSPAQQKQMDPEIVAAMLSFVPETTPTILIRSDKEGRAVAKAKAVKAAKQLQVYRIDLESGERKPMTIMGKDLDALREELKAKAHKFGCKWQFQPGLPGSGWWMTVDEQYGLVLLDVAAEADRMAQIMQVSYIMKEIERLGQLDRKTGTDLVARKAALVKDQKKIKTWTAKHAIPAKTAKTAGPQRRKGERKSAYDRRLAVALARKSNKK